MDSSSNKNESQNHPASGSSLTDNQAKTPVISLKSDTIVGFVVSFYSRGEGIDATIKDEFVKFLDSYAKNITYQSTHWGREGEIDYCIKINELSPSEQDSFVKKSKEILNKSALVHINKNMKCVHKH